MGVCFLNSFALRAFFYFCFGALSFAGSEALAFYTPPEELAQAAAADVPQPARRAVPVFPARPQAELVKDPQNESLCSIIGGDQFGRKLRYNGLRAADLQLFAETDADNARLAALYKQTARSVRVNERETRLIGYGSCSEMQKMVDALNYTYYNIPEVRCSSEDGQLFRVRRIGQRFNVDLLSLSSDGRSVSLIERRPVEITNTTRKDNGCLYRLVAPRFANAEEAKNFDLKICLADFSTKPSAKFQKTFASTGFPAPFKGQCEADQGFAEHALPLVHQPQASNSGLPPRPAPARMQTNTVYQ